MTRKRRSQLAVQLDLGVEAEPERPEPKGGGQVSGAGSWLRRCSVLEPVPGRVLWPSGRVVRDDERQRILLDPQVSVAGTLRSREVRVGGAGLSVLYLRRTFD